MLELHVLNEIQRLLAAGRLSQRAIARRVSVNRNTIDAIARGRLPKPPRAPPDADALWQPAGEPVRCPGCGGKVYLPCRLCRVRAFKRRQQARQRARRRLARPTSRTRCSDNDSHCGPGAP